ncbi:MAG: protein kinase domain-containing protein [Vicinamibacteria bacterium]
MPETKAPRSPAPDPVGRVLAGKYRIEALLKHGGMGAVYRATHLMLHKPVAIKLIKPELVTSQDTVRRFHREAQAASQLDHPNIVTIHDLGEAEDGTLYIAMELVTGTSLKELVKTEGALEPGRAVRIATAIGSALALAHRHQIIHRDLKPQNIMICRDAEGHEQPKLLDFGIAKTFESEGPALTSTGLVLGTPHYMSPEQAKGTAVDGRSDLYSLGIILYEMLVGKVPFEAPSIPAILVKHLNEAPKPPTALRPGLDPSLEAIVLRCLEKEPAGRYQTAKELNRALLDAESAVAARRPATVPSTAAAEGPTVPDASTNRATQPTVRLAEPPARQAVEPARSSGGKTVAIAAGVVVLLLLVVGGAGLWGISRLITVEPSNPTEGDDVPQGSPAAASLDPLTAPTSRTLTEDEQPQETVPDTAAPTAVEVQPEPATTPSRSPAQSTPREDSAAPPEVLESVPPPLPTDPSVEIHCQGLSDACASLRSELENSLRRAGLALAGADAPEVVVTLFTEEIESRSEEQFGTTFVVRTYSMEAAGQAPRFAEAVSMPPPEVFSFDTRLGRERLNERSRALSEAVTRSIRQYWSRRSQ